METIDRLESSIQKLSEAYRELRKERDDLSLRIQAAGEELDAAREKVQNLRQDLEKYMQHEGRRQDYDAKKGELKEYIQNIIDKIEKHHDSDNIDLITNG